MVSISGRRKVGESWSGAGGGGEWDVNGEGADRPASRVARLRIDPRRRIPVVTLLLRRRDAVLDLS